MTHEELVETVARALVTSHFGRHAPGWGWLNEEGRRVWRLNARAAIAAVAEAIKEPTLRMVRAGAQAQVADIPGESVEETCFRMSAAEWRAMLAVSPITHTPQEKP